MTSALAGYEYMLFSPKVQKNIIKYIFDNPMIDKPWAKFRYNTISSRLLSGIITKTTKLTALEFADKYLFKHLGITRRKWDADARGNNFGGMQIFLRSRDLARFGYLLLNKGHWDGKQLVPVHWVQQMTTKHSKGGFPEGDNYGMHCWVVDREEYSAFYASGYGQFIYVIPDLDVVVVITSDLGVHMKNKSIVPRYIIPAIK